VILSGQTDPVIMGRTILQSGVKSQSPKTLTFTSSKFLAMCDYIVGGLLPSVAQPPLPLQEFLPLQPASLVLHPPCPLHSF
jgi:hypothetical protein